MRKVSVMKSLHSPYLLAPVPEAGLEPARRYTPHPIFSGYHIYIFQYLRLKSQCLIYYQIKDKISYILYLWRISINIKWNYKIPKCVSIRNLGHETVLLDPFLKYIRTCFLPSFLKIWSIYFFNILIRHMPGARIELAARFLSTEF